ncbi:rhomboid family intramembrane serine protease [Chitinophaga nivalis]|uniref:Rhomboid family intramembrane serine protease n=1 Tax=Chitinophaga nivalis TaxID=2991709 RepID=A0ABT3IWC4_9BACT|nr:rhomboid family intramembrane serine protease [Chitinophaga nivalis]MCW3462304.1 rhomboid family intramembrane serine protease [Chitinophaga nivalis]MCW3488005.1 rhomboid family intramembrane serine protease [Chitinophaga nivalis]
MSNYRPGGFHFSLPLVIKNLMIINGLVWLIQMTLLHRYGYDMNDHFALHYWGSSAFRPYQFITHFFMHSTSNPWHLIMNMLILWISGATLENHWGPKRFLVFYLICGLGAALCYMGVLTYENITLTKYANAFLHDPTYSNFVALDNKFSLSDGSTSLSGLKDVLSHDPNNDAAIGIAKVYVQQYVHQYSNTVVVGASGAIYGILFAFGYLFPNNIVFYSFFFPVKAKFFAGFMIISEIWAGIQNAPDDNVAHFAHLGGVLFAYLLIKAWNRTHRKDFS